MAVDMEQLRKLHFSQVMVTARIGTNGELIRIEGFKAKMQAVLHDKKVPRIHTVVVAEEQQLGELEVSVSPFQRWDGTSVIQCEEDRDVWVVQARDLGEAVEMLDRVQTHRFGETVDLPPANPEFVGRVKLRQRIEKWISETASGYLVLVGGVGKGKTSFLTNWLQCERRRDDARRDPVFHFVSERASNTANPQEIAKSVSRQLLRKHGLTEPDDWKEQSWDWRLEETLKTFSRRLGSDEREVLVLDAADEAQADEDKPLLPGVLRSSLPRGILCLITSRTELRWLGHNVPRLDWDEQEDRDDIREFLKERGAALSPPLSDAFIEEIVAHPTEPPVFFTVARNLKELWQGSADAALDIDQLRREASLWRLPAEERIQVEAQWVVREVRKRHGLEENETWDVLATLALAREAVSEAVLQDLGLWDQRFRKVLQVAANFFKTRPLGRAPNDSYEFDHPGYYRVILGQDSSGECRLTPTELQTLRQRFADACRKVITALIEARNDKSTPRIAHDNSFQTYVIRHGVMHEIDAGDWLAVEAALCDWRYIELKRDANELDGLRAEYSCALAEWPDKDEQKRRDRDKEQQRILDQYSRDLIEHARNPDHVPLPAPPPLVELEPEHDVLERTPGNWRPFEHVRGWSQLVANYSDVLGNCDIPVFQTAYNAFGSGPVAETMDKLWKELQLQCGAGQWLRQINRAAYVPRSACVRILDCHFTISPFIAITPNGQRIVSRYKSSWSLNSKALAIHVWDAESGECLQTLKGHTNSVTSIAVTPDGRRIVSGSDDHTIRVWDSESGKCLRTLEGHEKYVAVTPDGQRIVSGSWDDSIRVWDPESGKCLCILEGDEQFASSFVVTPDGRRIVSNVPNRRNRTIRVWDEQTGEYLPTLNWTTDEDQTVTETLNGRRIVSGSDDTIRVWDAESGVCLRTLEGHAGHVTCVAVTPGHRRIVSGSRDNTIRVWDAESGKCLRTLEGHEGSVVSVAVTPDGSRIVSGSDDHTIRIWDAASGECLRTLVRNASEISSFVLTPNGAQIVSHSRDNTIRVWDAASGVCLRTLDGHEKSVESVAVTPDGQRIVSGSDDHTIRVWDAETGECLRTLEGHADKVESVAVTPDGRRIVSGSADKTIRVWDAKSFKCLWTSERLLAGVSPIVVTPDGRRILSLCSGFGDIWDAESGERLGSFGAVRRGLLCIIVTVDGRRIVSIGYQDEAIHVWDAVSGEWLQRLGENEERNCTNCVAVTPDGRFIVSGTRKTIEMWNAESGECMRTLNGHASKVVRVLTPDGCRIVSKSKDGIIRIWDAETGEYPKKFKGNTHAGGAVAVISADRRFACSSHGNSISFADHELVQTAAVCVRGGRCQVVHGKHLIVGTALGTICVFSMEAFEETAFVTPRNVWQFGHGANPGRWDDSLTILCPFCGTRSPVSHELCGQRIACEHCQASLQVNPFVCDLRDVLP